MGGAYAFHVRWVVQAKLCRCAQMSSHVLRHLEADSLGYTQGLSPPG